MAADAPPDVPTHTTRFWPVAVVLVAATVLLALTGPGHGSGPGSGRASSPRTAPTGAPAR